MSLKNKLYKYKPFFQFLIKFVLVYLLLVWGYKTYLKSFNHKPFLTDDITIFVSEVSTNIISTLGYHTTVLPHMSERSMVLNINDKPIVRVIEGCNAISVMLLFVAFVIAFSGPIKHTIWYSSLGAIFIFILNIIRVSFITVAIYHFPQYQIALHEIIFPIIIYGIMFILWIIWVNKFSYHAKEHQ